jgi:hypothetical protein
MMASTLIFFEGDFIPPDGREYQTIRFGTRNHMPVKMVFFFKKKNLLMLFRSKERASSSLAVVDCERITNPRYPSRSFQKQIRIL